MSTNLKKYGIGNQSFSKLIEDGYYYVDKTQYIPLLRRNTYCFLARPRRFGKSLLLSTLHEYFTGNRKLFKGLAIDNIESGEWVSYPVFHIDLNGMPYNEPDHVNRRFASHLQKWEARYGITNDDLTVSERFEFVIKQAVKQTGHRAVVLVDEYDKPLTDNLNDKDLFDKYQADLRGFYSVLKSLDKYLEFCLLTGVTKFGKLPVFSGLNNIKDISLSNEFSAICGITEKELLTTFDTGLREFAETSDKTVSEILIELKKQYDGYHFSKTCEDIYNPYSLINALADREIRNYWYESGNAKLLVELLEQDNYTLEELEGVARSEIELSSLTRHESDPVPLFYQTGYLSIKDYDPESRLYVLGYPNLEVKLGFMRNVMASYHPNRTNLSESIDKMKRALRAGDVDRFIEYLRVFCASVPYDLRRHQDYESFWQTVMYVIITTLGFYCDVEHHTSNGSIDLVVKTDSFIYIIELKMAVARKTTAAEKKAVNDALNAGIQQIKDRNYDISFRDDPRQIIRLAIAFSPRTGTVAAARSI